MTQLTLPDTAPPSVLSRKPAAQAVSPNAPKGDIPARPDAASPRITATPPPTEIDGLDALTDPPSFSDRFAAGWQKRTIEADTFDYTGRLEMEFALDLARMLPAEGRQRLKDAAFERKIHPGYGPHNTAQMRELLFVEVARARADGLPPFLNAPVDEAAFQEAILADRRRSYEEADRLLSIDGAGVGGFLGGMARDIVDPINIMLAPAGVGGGIARTVAAETAIGGIAAGLGLPGEFRVAEELDLPRPDVFNRIVTEALASGGLALGIHGLARGASAYLTRNERRGQGKPDPAVPDSVHEEAQRQAEDELMGQVPERDLTRSQTEGAFVPPDFDFSLTGNASPRDNRVGYVFGKLLENGMEPHVAAGFVGNFMVESGIGLNPLARGDGGYAHGIAQWNDRRHALFRFAERRGTSWDDLDTQIAFLLHELETSEAGAWAKIRRASTAAEAAQMVSRYYERPGIPHMNRRVSYANGVIEQFEGGNVPKGGQTSAASYTPYTGTSRGYTSTGQVRTAGGTRIDVEYEVVDASLLVRAGGDLQPRDRTLVNSDAQIADMAASLDPALLMPAPTADRGAPIVGPDNIVESGNGRNAAISMAAERFPDRFNAYRQQIEAAGFAIPEGVQTPVLVGRRVSAMDDAARRRFVIEAQDSGVARMTPVERGRAEAATLDPATLSRLDAAAPLTDAANADFARAALARLPATERNAFVAPNGVLNREGEAALQRALFARAYDDAEILRRFTEQDQGEFRALLDALADASPAWAQLRADVVAGNVRAEFDITPHIMDAMRLISQARSVAGREGLPVADIIEDMLSDIDLLTGAVPPLTQALVRKFWKNGRAASRKDIGAFLTRYANEARKVGRADAGLFGQGPDALDVLQKLDPDTFGDLTELGTARVRPDPPQDVVQTAMPEDAYAQGAQSAEALDAAQEAVEELRSSISEGPFGPVLTDFEGDWRGAVRELEARQSGEATGALTHKDIGPISLVWGEVGTGRGTGYGLAKIKARHPEALNDLQGLIARTDIVSKSENRIILESEAEKAVVRLDWDGEAKTWLMTAFEKQRGGDRSTGRAADLPEGSSPSAPPRNENNSDPDIIQDAQPSDLRAALEARAAVRSELLSDGDFEILTDSGDMVKASEILEDLDDEEALATVVQLCATKGGANA
ncbi:phage tail tip lysozyme [Roseovarius atlanticus]|uniref:phage tail tip lysozyme n=1 Tax=Roseovarius atlanticus TaxID=1641875 RepID=UPI001C95E5BE|nr:phage tail tip lysozyme [Roseovarius atlanticus]MBY5988218.1 hypothetical protein [Roseovarius atlanticus]MBY6123609.1 hypothetical protein [Roseovarius atlanticus]MBY6148104.1 hypothetical protein [Roseovarius atlanticus]